ncbi:hypothetical protein SteCoe_4239 [Stentor coeruleus]|uniref:Uncharacterized protein n=1 Tax=Stentor coeruleus TaxID=5963 RepID=A0A1R2CVA2_9CILI|nr:hypothetical protein SteCoe_4239 [Stentor coeruleus]
MKISKSHESFGNRSRNYACGDLYYNWESSIPDIIKKHSRKHLRHVSNDNSKSTSIDYLKFSDKILEEYSKNPPHTVKARTRRQPQRKTSLSSDIASKSLPVMPSFKFQLPKYRYNSTTNAINQNFNKVHELTTFSFNLPDAQAEKYMIHTYSIPNGLIKTKAQNASNQASFLTEKEESKTQENLYKNLKKKTCKTFIYEHTTLKDKKGQNKKSNMSSLEKLTVTNPNLKAERRGVLGAKIVRINKNSRKLTWCFRCENC